MASQENPSYSRRRRQGVYWLLTVPYPSMGCEFDDPGYTLPESIRYLRGQRERGESTGYEHWQVLAIFFRKTSLHGVKQVFGDGIHAELSYSKAANDYVWKEATRVEGTVYKV